MKTTNGNAFQILTVLSNLTETGRLGFAIAKQRRIIEAELREFIDIRNKAITDNAKDGTLTADGAVLANQTIAQYIDLPCEFRVVPVDEETFTGGGLNSAQMYDLSFMTEGDSDGK